MHLWVYTSCLLSSFVMKLSFYKNDYPINLKENVNYSFKNQEEIKLYFCMIQDE